MTPYIPPFGPLDLLMFGGALAISVLLVGCALLACAALWFALIGWAGDPRARVR